MAVVNVERNPNECLAEFTAFHTEEYYPIIQEYDNPSEQQTQAQTVLTTYYSEIYDS
jgi:hypothetical protein